MSVRKMRPVTVSKATMVATAVLVRTTTPPAIAKNATAPAPTRLAMAVAPPKEDDSRRERNVRSNGNEQGEKKAANPVAAANASVPAVTSRSAPTKDTKPA